MKEIKFLALTLSLAAVSSCIFAQKLADVAPYPSPEKNQNRNIIWLDKHENEEVYKIEIVASKSGLKDCNYSSFLSNIKEKTLKGWGYTYFVIGNADKSVTTLMGCINQKKQVGDIPLDLSGNTIMRYNSKLPLVIYAPKDVKVKINIFKIDKTQDAEISNN